MRSSKLFILFALLLGLFFLAQFVAELAFLSVSGEKPGKPVPSLIGLSLSSRLHTGAAFALLEAGEGNGDKAKVRQAMRLLARGIGRNPLDYQARYYLAKAYLALSAMDNNYFELGINELRRAAAIRGSNKSIALDCGRLFFSLWPLLEDKDRDFCSGLLAGIMPTISWPEFSPLLEMWSLYVQDAPMLMELLRLKPQFFRPAADQLVAAGLPLAKRWEMMALYEASTLDSLERRYNELNLQGGAGLDNARSMLGSAREVRGYYRLHAGSGFDVDRFLKLRRALLIEIIDAMIAPARVDAGQAAQLRALIEYYIAEHSGLGELDELQKLLEERKYFKENDFPSLRLKMMIAFKKGDYGGVVAEVESVRKGISFVKKEQAADYSDILLLLTDSYYSSKLMTAAEAVARELYENQPDSQDVLWRVLRIRNVLGAEGQPDPELDAKLAKVAESRFLVLGRINESRPVYLFNQPQIEVTLDPALRAGIGPGQLVQVFVDDKIAAESYGRDLPEKFLIGPPLIRYESKTEVKVTVK